MDLEHLKTFCVVAQHKSFRKASELLQLTQPGVSRRIKSLEDELGFPLFQRTPQSVALTKQGKDFLPFAERTVQILSEGTKKVMQGAKEEKLVIAGTPTTCFNLLPEILREYSLQYRTPLTVYTAPSDKVFDMILDQTIDLGFTTASFPGPLANFEKIFDEEIVCVGHPDFVREYFNEGRICKFPVPVIFVPYSIESKSGNVIDQYFLNNSLFDVIVDAQYIQMAENLARIGLGLAIVPISDAFQDLKKGNLVKVKLPNLKMPKRPVYSVTYKDRQIKKSAVQFLEIVKRFKPSYKLS